MNAVRKAGVFVEGKVTAVEFIINMIGKARKRVTMRDDS